MLTKTPLPKQTETIDIAEDLGMVEYENVQFVMWKDPSRKVVSDLLGVILVSAESIKDLDSKRQNEINDQFFAAVSELIVDSSVEGLDFSTKESCEASFENPSLPWGFCYSVVSYYIIRLLETNNNLKNALAALSGNTPSGNVASKKAKKSKAASPKESKTTSQTA